MSGLCDLAVDANRDGTIKLASEDASDATSATNPYRFWLNVDDDAIVDSSARVPVFGDVVPPIYTEIEQDDDQVLNESQQNWRSGTITCERDLEDFFPLLISTKGLTESLQKGDIKLGFKWSNITRGAPTIKVFPAADNVNGTSQLFNELAANYQIK